MLKKGKNRRKNKQRTQHSTIRQVASKRLPLRKREEQAQDVVDYANRLIGCQRWREASEALKEHDHVSPGNLDVLQLLLHVHHHLRDYGSYCRVCRKLLDKAPNEPELHLMLADGYLHGSQIANSLRTFRRFLELWPDHQLADGARRTAAQVESALDELLAGFHFPEEEKFELAAIHEEIMDSLSEMEHQRVIALAERLLSRCPNFIPVLNNVSHAYFWTGQTDKAVATSRRVLELDPDNFHALANCARYMLIEGRRDEAEVFCERLRSARSDNADIWAKKAETFSFFGDDRAVLDAFDEAHRAGCTKDKTPEVALLYHLAAVAHARQGRTATAKRLWHSAIKINPAFDLPSDNLEDGKRPPADRHGPWPFRLDYWIRKDIIAELAAAVEGSMRRRNEEAVGRAARRFAAKHPQVVSLVPILLDRGDEAGREFAWRLAMLVETPELLQSLREFCLSQRGPDAMRLETANYLCRRGVLESEPTRLWLHGRWEDVELIGFEITTEPTGITRLPPVGDWSYDAVQAIHRGDGIQAETLLKKCLEREGDQPDLLNNLATAYQVQGRGEEAIQLVHSIHERWPDYFFGCISMSRIAVNKGDYTRAKQYLTPLRRRRVLHQTEFTAMCAAYVELFLGQRKLDVAKTWLDMWKEIDPDLMRYEPLISLGKMFKRLPKWLTGRVKK